MWCFKQQICVHYLIMIAYCYCFLYLQEIRLFILINSHAIPYGNIKHITGIGILAVYGWFSVCDKRCITVVIAWRFTG